MPVEMDRQMWSDVRNAEQAHCWHWAMGWLWGRGQGGVLAALLGPRCGILLTRGIQLLESLSFTVVSSFKISFVSLGLVLPLAVWPFAFFLSILSDKASTISGPGLLP